MLCSVVFSSRSCFSKFGMEKPAILFLLTDGCWKAELRGSTPDLPCVNVHDVP